MHALIRKYVLKNAFDFQGKANSKVVLGAVLKEKPELKSDIPKLLKEIETAVKEVEKLSAEKIRKELEKNAPELLQLKQEAPREGLKPLAQAEQGKVVVRIAPSPSGPLHIGHAYGVLINDEYARMYKGKIFLRIEDTNPENIYPPAYEQIERDVQWLTGNNLGRVDIQSDRLGTYYDAAEKLVQLGRAYVCTCNADAWREEKNAGKACSCRELPVKEQQVRYAKMFNGYAEGEAVLRLKTDIQHPNPAMRDFGIMRIVEHIHPKKGKEQRVWPLMVFSVAIDDHELGITHVLNGKDHADNAKKEAMIMDIFGWKIPQYQHWGRINFEGFHLSTSDTRRAIEQGEYKGWDDIRLPFLPALRRRGYQPEAFRKFAKEMGLSLSDKHVSGEEFWKMINAFNREVIEKQANRYFFIEKPMKITLEGAPKREVQLDLHPDFPQRGKRIFSVSKTFWIAEADLRMLAEGYLHRLMDCCNFVVEGKSFRYVQGTYDDYKNAAERGRIIHWLPLDQTVPVSLLMEKGQLIEGLGEETLLRLSEGSIIQFERQYFVRVDKKEHFAKSERSESFGKEKEKNLIRCWYLHK